MFIVVGSRSKRCIKSCSTVCRKRPSMTVGLRLLASGEQSINKAKASNFQYYVLTCEKRQSAYKPTSDRRIIHREILIAE